MLVPNLDRCLLFNEHGREQGNKQASSENRETREKRGIDKSEDAKERARRERCLVKENGEREIRSGEVSCRKWKNCGFVSDNVIVVLCRRFWF